MDHGKWTVVAIGCVMVMCAGTNGAELSEREKQVLHTVGEHNRANRRSINAIRLQYTYEDRSEYKQGTFGRCVRSQGVYAFDGDREYSEHAIPAQGYTLTYVRVGNQVRTASLAKPRLVAMGKASNDRLRKGAPDPWGIMLDDIGSRIDRLDEKEARVTKVGRYVLPDGRKAVRAIIEMARTLPTGGGMSVEYVVCFSESQSYLPVKLSGKVFNEDRSKVLGGGEGEITDMMKVNIGGRDVYVPMSYHDRQFKNDILDGEVVYRVNKETIEINPDLPDELFEIRIRPDDQVVNLDLDMELHNPFGRELLVAEVKDSPYGTRDGTAMHANGAEERFNGGDGASTVPSASTGRYGAAAAENTGRGAEVSMYVVGVLSALVVVGAVVVVRSLSKKNRSTRGAS